MTGDRFHKLGRQKFDRRRAAKTISTDGPKFLHSLTLD